MSLPDIFAANSFRDFLRDYYVYRKSRKPSFSYASFAKLVGFASRSYIPLLISGDRKLSADGVEKFRKIFSKHTFKFNHFRLLVQRDQARTTKERKRLETLIRAEREKPAMKTDLPAEAYSVYNHWFNIPIQMMPRLKGFEASPSWIRSHLAFPVSLSDVEVAMKQLYQLGLWKKDSEGNTVCASLNSHDEFNPRVLKKFHLKMLDLGRIAADEQKSRGLHMATTMVLNEEQLEEMRSLLLRLRQVEMAAVEKAQELEALEKIYQITFLVFPLTTI